MKELQNPVLPMIRCDEDGVPKIVQSVEYSARNLHHYANLFDGSVYRVLIPSTLYPRSEMNDDKVYTDVEDLVNARFQHNHGRTTPQYNERANSGVSYIGIRRQLIRDRDNPPGALMPERELEQD